MHTSQEYSAAGFFTSTVMSAIHFQDVIMALMLGFFGAAGGYLFKLLKDYLEKRKGR